VSDAREYAPEKDWLREASWNPERIPSHEYVDNGGRCARCGVAADRAIHSPGFAAEHGFTFVAANREAP
jgi:hypothetical protein